MSERNGWRVPEIVLHGLALLGGSPAAWLAQQTFRHKTKKLSFKITFWIIVVIQIALSVYLIREFL